MKKVTDDSYFSEDDYISEMATIALSKGLNIAVNQERNRISIAYFKVYDHPKILAAEKVARLHFKDSGIEIHDKDPSIRYNGL